MRGIALGGLDAFHPANLLVHTSIYTVIFLVTLVHGLTPRLGVIIMNVGALLPVCSQSRHFIDYSNRDSVFSKLLSWCSSSLPVHYSASCRITYALIPVGRLGRSFRQDTCPRSSRQFQECIRWKLSEQQ